MASIPRAVNMGYDHAMENRYILFLDFLGASQAARTWEDLRLQEFVDLLHWVATARARESTDGEAMPDGGYRLRLVPEVTTFSDNVVVSYSGSSDDNQMLAGLWVSIVCQDCVRLLTKIAERALELGVLIRGGLTYGRCHHTDGVVFGEGMVDAYNLESREAVNPRVLVSQKVIDRLKIDRPANMRTLLQDTEDGRWHLNYFIDMIKEGVPGGSEMPRRIDDWLARSRQIIAQNTAALDGQDRQQAKWRWFAEHFQHSADMGNEV